MGKGLTATLCLIALSVGARAEEVVDLRGQWHIKAAAMPNYVGIVLIDAEHRVTWDAPVDRGKPARFQGYAAHIDGTRLDIALTDRVAVVHMNCKIETSDLLHCVTLWRDGSVSQPYDLTRKASGPKKLMPVLP
jgi:hypothetical protein